MKILIAWASLTLPLLVAADTVVPVEKVESYVNIRQAPDNDAEVLGRLQQGESLPLVATENGWNEVQLESGDSGFISADWSLVIADEVDQASESGVEPEPEVAAEPEPESGTLAQSASEEDSEEAPDTEVLAKTDSEQQPEDTLEIESESEVESEGDTEPSTETETAVEIVTATESAETAQTAVVAGPPGPPGPPGPAGPPGVDGDGAIKGKPGFLVKFKDETTGNASQIFDNGNQIGIGTDEPSQRLDVNGSVQIHDRNSNLAGLMITQADGETGYIMHNRASTLTIGAGSIDRMTIDRDGNIGIGTARPVHPLHMASGAHVTAGGVWTNSSSRSRKENIQSLSLEDAMATLQQLEPVHFNYKSDMDEAHIGFIAEDVPELVATDDRKGLSTMDIVAVLTRVIQAQQQQIQDLEARLDAD